MGTSDRRERHRASLRRRILDAASQLFVEEGYDRLTMRRIAARIEYSPTTIYLHFKDKNELLAAVCDETFSQLAARLERLQKTSGTPLGYLREGLRTCVDFGLAHPNQYTVAFMGLGACHGPDGAALGHAIGGRAFEALRGGVRACVESGDIQTPSVERTALALWAGVRGITSLLTTTKEPPSADRQALVDHLIDTLVAGLRNPAATTRSSVAARSKKWDFFD
jgi:AcrR family transcriptional regulator